MAAALDAVAASSFSYYNLLKGYPIAGWGEQGIVAVQATVVLILVWIYRGNNLKVRFAFFGLWMCISAAILFEGHECHLLLTSLGASPTAMTAISRIPQIFLNWQSGQTGQLSLITFFLQFLGSVARLLTTLQLIGNDALTLISHSVGAILNLVVVLQILAHHNQLKLAVKAAKVNIVALEKSVWDVSEWWVWWADSRKMRPGLADVFSSSAALRAVTIVGPVIEGQWDDGENEVARNWGKRLIAPDSWEGWFNCGYEILPWRLHSFHILWANITRRNALDLNIEET